MKDIFDYDLMKKCRVCKNNSIKSNFKKIKRRKMVIDQSVDLVVRNLIIIIEINHLAIRKILTIKIEKKTIF